MGFQIVLNKVQMVTCYLDTFYVNDNQNRILIYVLLYCTVAKVLY